MSHGIAATGYRLPDAAHIGRVRLQVTDLDRSARFYQEIIGLTVLNTTQSTVTLGAGETPLVELYGGARAARRARRLGLYHFAILLPDRAALGRSLTHLLDNGIQPGAADHLVSEALYLQDPDDLGIEIYRDRPREEWTTRGDELVMTTEPLDSNGVLHAAEGRWSGLPAGTTIGHVHLHVGDLQEAKAFYHAALGLDLVVWSYPGALFMSAGGYHHHLGLNTWAGSRAQGAPADEPKLLDWELVVPTSSDVAAAVAALSGGGFAVSGEEVGGSVATDPWGTSLKLVAATT